MMDGAAFGFSVGAALLVFLGALLWRVFSKTTPQSSEQEVLILRERIRAASQSLDEARGEVERARLRETELRGRIAELQSKEAVLEEAQNKLLSSFEALSAEALKQNNESFLSLATQTLGRFQEKASGDLERRQQTISELLNPVKSTLERFDHQVADLEKQRVGAYESLSEQVRQMMDAQKTLRDETSNLASALRSPVVRGRWGEIQLKRVAEMAGMLDHCDFYEQMSVNTEDGRQRPDMVVRYPGNKYIAVDSKVPLMAFLDAIEEKDEERRRKKFGDHAAHLKKHILDLGRKAYWEQFDSPPESVVLFVPGDHFLNAALEYDPGLIELGVEQKVLLATPTTLIMLLRSAAYGWRQESLTENAEKIATLGRELHKRLADMGGHFSRLGRSLGGAVEHFNKAIRSLDTRVFVTARKFVELEADHPTSEIEAVELLDQLPQKSQAQELLPFERENEL